MESNLLDDDFFEENPSTIKDKKTIQLINKTKINANEKIKDVKNAQTTLIVLSVLVIIGMIVSLSMNSGILVSHTEIIIESVFLFCVYSICAFRVRFNPRVSILIALLLYLFMNVLIIFLEPQSAINGFILKMIIIFYLLKGTIAAFQLNKNFELLYSLGVPKKEIEDAKKKFMRMPLMEYPKEIQNES